MWKLELDETYFRIFDTNKDIAGYFDPDYGKIFPQDKEYEIIEKMLKHHEKVPGGFVMVPLAKFEIFDRDDDMSISQVQDKIISVSQRLSAWNDFLQENKIQFHSIRISHTDQDMLSIAFPIKFSSPTPLDKNILLPELEPILDLMQKQNLL